ncbi:MAG: aldo/keto reductase [Lachnospiraceae bacterium]
MKKEISRIGLGCWSIGGGPAWGGDKDEKQCIDAIRACPEYGIKLIDTAPGYNFGQSERMIGKALKGMNREEITLITKFGLVWTRTGAPFNKVGDVQLYRNVSRESIMEEIDASLERLDVDYIDIYMSHWQAAEPFPTPIAETMEALNELKVRGKIRGIGAANVSVSQAEEYMKYGELNMIQAKYSVLDRGAEDELLPLCREKGIVFQAYSPLEQGMLSGRLNRDYVPKGAQCSKKWFQSENMPKAMDFMDELREGLCKKYRCTVADLAMAWVLAQDEKITILTGTANKEHLKENTNAAALELEEGDAALMREMAEALER